MTICHHGKRTGEAALGGVFGCRAPSDPPTPGRPTGHAPRARSDNTAGCAETGKPSTHPPPVPTPQAQRQTHPPPPFFLRPNPATGAATSRPPACKPSPRPPSSSEPAASVPWNTAHRPLSQSPRIPPPVEYRLKRMPFRENFVCVNVIVISPAPRAPDPLPPLQKFQPRSATQTESATKKGKSVHYQRVTHYSRGFRQHLFRHPQPPGHPILLERPPPPTPLPKLPHPVKPSKTPSLPPGMPPPQNPPLLTP